MSHFGSWFHITFKYLKRRLDPQYLGDVKHWDIYQPLQGGAPPVISRFKIPINYRYITYKP